MNRRIFRGISGLTIVDLPEEKRILFKRSKTSGSSIITEINEVSHYNTEEEKQQILELFGAETDDKAS